MDIVLSFAALLPMLGASLFAGRLAGIAPIWRRRLGSFAGGVASAYVFLAVLPKLADQQVYLEQAVTDWPLIDYFYHHAYVVALAGFVAYYLVNAMAQVTAASVPRSMRGAALVVGFGAYSGLIGDLVASLEPRPLSLALVSIALTLHLVGLDLSLYRHLSHSWGWLRGVLTAGLFLGWLVGHASPIPPAIHALISAWLAGSIIILVVLLELPEKRRPGAFVAGALTFTLLLRISLHLMGLEGGV
jgi:hypothetical protein